MPRPPTTIAIATSRLSLAAQGLVAAAAAGLVVGVASPWTGAFAVLLLALVMVTVARRRLNGQLLITPKAAGRASWAWRDHGAQPWRPVSLSCDYLGPWLIGLRVDGRRLWLWPDSSDPESLRRLRQELLPLP
ncbi:protein YgfX [Halomonas aquatica]|uniref:Protein YgfX n=1 Tax=Halomonas aquatica TaxID=3151123 RepID=A0ABV1NGE8_9GAMM